MDKNTLLYVLSTLAQTCAALAAFVGAAGVYRLQSLGQMRRDRYNDISAKSGTLRTRDAMLSEARQVAKQDPVMAELLHRYDAVEPIRRRSTRALFIFELWQLLVILISLVGFIYLDELETWEYTSHALGVLAVVTVGVTPYCVLAWFSDNA